VLEKGATARIHQTRLPAARSWALLNSRPPILEGTGLLGPASAWIRSGVLVEAGLCCRF
jgi:hypothetical protein